VRSRCAQESEEWHIARVEMAGNKLDGSSRPQASRHTRRPISVHAKIAAIVNGADPRYKGENVLALELEMPERTTQDYEGIALNPTLKQAIDAALDDSEEISLEGQQNLPSMFFSYDPEGKKRGGKKKK
jgi:kinesin family protein 3/17